MKIALGTAQFSPRYGIKRDKNRLNFLSKKKLIKVAKKFKINTIDTAASYGNAEFELGKIGIKNFKVMTKLPLFNTKSINLKKNIKFYVKGLLKKLNIKKVYAILIHNNEYLTEEDRKAYIKILKDLKKRGLINKIGISLYDIKEVEPIFKYWKPDIIQLPYNIIDRRIENNSLIKKLKKNKIEIHVRSIFLQGLLSEKKRPKKFYKWNNLFNKWFNWCAQNNLKPYEAAYLFVLRNKNINKIVIGFSSINELLNLVKIKKKYIKNFPRIKSNETQLINAYNWKNLHTSLREESSKFKQEQSYIPIEVPKKSHLKHTNNIAIVQARLNSHRYPRKVLEKINGHTMLRLIYERLKKSKKIEKIIFAIPNNKREKELYENLNKSGMDVYLGDEEDVLDRYYKAAKKYRAKNILRVTGDCPLVDPELVDQIISFYEKNSYDYVNNNLNPTYPHGLDLEFFSFQALKTAWKETKKQEDREHVTTFLRNNEKIKKFCLVNKHDFSNLRWTIDFPVDYSVVKKIYEHFKPNIFFGWKDALDFCLKNKKILVNKYLEDKFYEKTNRNKFWTKAKNSIAGGNSMISKHPDVFLPNRWPTYFKKTKGCEIWDLDGKKYYDLSMMGCGTNILGYSNIDVDRSVMKVVKQGNLSTLNCVEEVLLAEKLISINKWADKVLFARTGGEANAIAVRLARAFTEKDRIAVCGYHGWHDWFLSASKKNENIIRQKHLPFYSTTGVPKSLKNSIINFDYNNFESLEKLIHEDKTIGCSMMEVIRNIPPKNNFLQKVRKFADKYNKVLIFDECTTGFRETFGGIHKKFGVFPDIAIYGKALGNGYPITCVVGKNDIMNMKKKTFISSTFWTDRIGPAAGLKTLEVMEKIKSWKTITQIGETIIKRWKMLGEKYNLPLYINGIPSLCNFTFKSKNDIGYRTLISQEMLKYNFLANNIVYSSVCHKDKILKSYFQILDRIFSIINDCENGDNINKYIKSLPTQSYFRKIHRL